MATVLVVAIRDRALDGYSRPFFVPTLGAAIRSFQDEVNRSAPDNQLFSHSDDFDLYQLGTFSEDTGQFENLPQPRQIAVGKQLKQ